MSKLNYEISTARITVGSAVLDCFSVRPPIDHTGTLDAIEALVDFEEREIRLVNTPDAAFFPYSGAGGISGTPSSNIRRFPEAVNGGMREIAAIVGSLPTTNEVTVIEIEIQ